MQCMAIFQRIGLHSYEILPTIDRCCHKTRQHMLFKSLRQLRLPSNEADRSDQAVTAGESQWMNQTEIVFMWYNPLNYYDSIIG